MPEFTRLPEPLPQLRAGYLNCLEEPQEFFLEELVGLGEVWAASDASYGVMHGETLVEFFSPDPKNSTRRLRNLHNQHGFSTTLVKSFDHMFMRSCEELGWRGSVGGFLFRKRNPRTHAAFPGAALSAATPADGDALWEIDDDFFESPDEVAALAEAEKLWTVRVSGEIAGCGVTNRFIAESDAVDIGVMVAQSFRRRGLGTHVVSEIANRVEDAGLRPICGCGAGNAASKATLEKAGFVSEHQLMSFTAG